MAGTPLLVEACVTSAAEAAGASRAGSHRVELCRDLHTGGLTPLPEVVHAVRERAGVPLFAMVRPTPGTFRAAPATVGTMLREIEHLVGLGVDGIVVGVLDGAGRVDVVALREIVDTAGVPVTFHRAFDELAEPLAAVEQLVTAGCARVLTAGRAETAWAGRSTLRDLARLADGRLEVVAGGGVRGDHVRRLVETTGVREVHARASAIPGIVRALG